MDGGDGCTMWMYMTLLNCVLKMVTMVFFTLCIFCHCKQRKRMDRRRTGPNDRHKRADSEPEWPTCRTPDSQGHRGGEMDRSKLYFETATNRALGRRKGEKKKMSNIPKQTVKQGVGCH